MLKDFEGARNTEMIRGSRVASVHDIRSGQIGPIYVDGVIEGGSAPAAVVAIRRGGDGDRDPRGKLVPSHGGCSSTRHLRCVKLQWWPRYPGQWFARQGALWAASGRTGGWEPSSDGAKHDDPVGLWSLGDPSAEAVTSEGEPSEEALERRRRRTHCGRPCGGPSAMGRCLSGSLFGFTCLGHKGAKWCHTGLKLRRRNRVFR